MSKITDKFIEVAFSIFYPLTEIIAMAIIANGLSVEHADEWNNETIANETVDLYKSIIVSKELEKNDEEEA